MVAAAQAESRTITETCDGILVAHKAKQIQEVRVIPQVKQPVQIKPLQPSMDLWTDLRRTIMLRKEAAASSFREASASISTGIGFNVGELGDNRYRTLEGSHQLGLLHQTGFRSTAKDYSKQTNFQAALNQASQAARDTRYSELSDQGKRVVSSINDSYEKSHQYRDEASASLQKSQSFSEMASWTKQNAGSINASLNQEYVNWLQTQSLPNSSGPMGIHEAETILATLPRVNAQYQQRFMEEKVHTLENHLSDGLPQIRSRC